MVRHVFNGQASRLIESELFCNSIARVSLSKVIESNVVTISAVAKPFRCDKISSTRRKRISATDTFGLPPQGTGSSMLLSESKLRSLILLPHQCMSTTRRNRCHQRVF